MPSPGNIPASGLPQRTQKTPPQAQYLGSRQAREAEVTHVALGRRRRERGCEEAAQLQAGAEWCSPAQELGPPRDVPGVPAALWDSRGLLLGHRGCSPALLWAPAAQPPRLFLEDPEDPVRCQELVPAQENPEPPHHHRVALGWVPLATPWTYHWSRGPGDPVPARQPRWSRQVRAVHPKPSRLPWQTGHARRPWGTRRPSWTLEETWGAMAEGVPPLPAGRTGTHPHSPAGSPGHR